MFDGFVHLGPTHRAVGRFAPSPTGPLHLGSLAAALGSWLFARARDGTWLVRIEDLDPPRVVPGSADEILASLEAFGFRWDGEVVRQSERAARYDEALARLRDGGFTFECACSRAEIRRAASAPAPGDPVDPSGAVYPGTCRNGLAPGRRARATRFRAPDEIIEFDDLVRGRIREDVASRTGDFVVRRADGLHAYQLAVVVDDLAQGVTQVVRGSDLLSSTARQIAIIRALGAEPPTYAHLPLVHDARGEKLAKRNGALPLDSLCESAIVSSLRSALRILGQDDVEPDTPARMLAQAVSAFDPARIPANDVSLRTA
jgi:glutamyl-Q tRNA(Asp) synthetase